MSESHPRKLRKILPYFSKYHQTVDLDALMAQLTEFNLLDINQYVDDSLQYNGLPNLTVKTNSFNKQFFVENGDLTDDTKYKQKFLSMPSLANNEFDESEYEKSQSIFHRMKRLNRDSDRYNEQADEFNHNVVDQYRVGELGRIFQMFDGKVNRVRLAYLSPRFHVQAHIDYDPSYIFRYHIPLITNELCTMNCAERAVHFPADGGIYWLNTGLKHWVENNSDQGRIHLIIDVSGEEEYEHWSEKHEEI